MKPTASNDRPATTCLAWAGWRLNMPAEWRPLNITGTMREGTMVIGTSSQVFLHLKWWRPSFTTIDTDRWLRRRLKKTARPQLRASAATLSADFLEHAWVPNTSSANPAAKAVWIGRAVATPLVIECVLNLAAQPAMDRLFLQTVLPTLTLGTAPPGTLWSVFNVSFVTPPGFDLADKRLFPGDMALWFRNGANARLLVRQIYPADLALGRMTLEQWLAGQPFKEYYRYYPGNAPADWQLAYQGARWPGLKRSGFKRLPVPLGGWYPRYSQSAIVRDPELDRLLVCAYESPEQDDGRMLEHMLASMNWAQRDTRRQAA
jgi:hypothetical protein